MKRSLLKVEKRKILGRKVKNLRKQGILPASIYGQGIKSISVQVPLKETIEIFRKAGETGLVDLQMGTSKKKTVLLKNPQFDPVSDQLIHLDFHQVKLTEKVTVAVPLEIVGKSPTIEKGEGILVQILDEVEIEALPADLPEKFIVDVSQLKKINDAFTVADLKIDLKKISLKVAKDQVLVKIEPPAKEEEKEEKPVEEAAETEAQPEEKPAEKEGEEKEKVGTDRDLPSPEEKKK